MRTEVFKAVNIKTAVFCSEMPCNLAVPEFQKNLPPSSGVLPSSWRQKLLPKCWYIFTRLHGITSQKNMILKIPVQLPYIMKFVMDFISKYLS
jgi:hypothetical protein